MRSGMYGRGPPGALPSPLQPDETRCSSGECGRNQGTSPGLGRWVWQKWGMSRSFLFFLGYWPIQVWSIWWNYMELQCYMFWDNMLCQFQIKTGKAVPWFPAKPAKDHVHQFQEHRHPEAKQSILDALKECQDERARKHHECWPEDFQFANDKRWRKRIARCPTAPWHTMRSMSLFEIAPGHFLHYLSLDRLNWLSSFEFHWVVSAELIIVTASLFKMVGVLDRVARASWKCGGEGLHTVAHTR